MVPMTDGIDARTGKPISNEVANWTTHPNNPMRKQD
jgi:dihydropyrimidine dehydrogenase (NAD+) subunit PreA